MYEGTCPRCGTDVEVHGAGGQVKLSARFIARCPAGGCAVDRLAADLPAGPWEPLVEQ